MKKMLFALGLHLVFGCFNVRAAYSIYVTSQGSASRTVQPGESFDLDILLVSDAADTNNSAIFRVVFSAPGLLYESYRWSTPYNNGTAEDDSKPLFPRLPALLQASTLSGPGYPNNVVDVELSNVTGIQPGFGSGSLARLTISAPLNYAGPTNVSVTVEPDSFAKGFSMIPIAGTSPFFLTVAEPASSNLILVSEQSLWKYLDNGTDQGIAWRMPNFDDTFWPSGLAELGYGDGDEATVVGYGLDPNNKHITTYFRKTFNMVDGAAYRDLPFFLRVRRDDGIAVYLNGTEILRDNLSSGNVRYDTLASGIALDDGYTWFWSAIDSDLLINGTNVLAAEVHQYDVGSSDISFDLELSTVGCTSRRLKIVKMGNESIILWPCRADGYRLEVTDGFRQPVRWNAVTIPPSVAGPLKFLRIGSDLDNAYFRLIKP